MFLKTLNIIGFKTFADETEIHFDPGFTAVVGPNGSGKSNIVDAIKWVLGEKSAKSIRGDKMEDVIFHGSETREPSGFAEVSILLDNSKKIFQIDFPTVKITRRIYPDLTNEYFINNSRVLRRDVEKLLLDTGIGKVSYSIMEQGRVEAILNSKPEERRAIFDEAAGISRYKLDKLETEKKLEQTNQNLLRINDIMLTMQRELETKEKQAEKAKAYFQLKNELSEVDKNLRYLKLKALKSRQKKLETELAEVKEKNDQILSKMSADARRVEELEKERLTQEQKIAEIDKQLFDFLSQKELLREKIENNKKLILDYEIRIEEQNGQFNSETNRVLEIENNLQIIEESISQTKENIQLSEGTILSFIKKRTEFEKELENLLKEISEFEAEISQNDKFHNEFREQVKELVVSIINQIEAKKLESENSESKRVELKNYLLQSLDEFIQITENIQLNVYDVNAIHSAIQKLTLREFREKLREFLDIEDIFRDILFDKEGMLAQKQNLDQKIEDIILRNDELTNKIRENNQKIETIREAISQNKEEVYNLEKQILEWKTRLISFEENKLNQKRQLEETYSRITQIQTVITSLNDKKQQVEEEVNLLQAKIEEYSNEFLSIGKILESEKLQLTNLQTEIQNLKLSQGKDQEEFKSLLPILSELERRCSGIKVQLDTFNEELYNEYSITDEELEKERAEKNLKQDTEEARLREIKSEIQLLGSINPLAIEEYQQVKEIYEHHKTQREDIEKSKADIENVLKNISAESEKIFLETFELIKKNFQETFSTLFNGGRAILELTDKTDALNSGIEIIAEPPGKHVQNLKLLSGGEKSLTVIALLFAIYMVRPSPFCFLDEIDAALDEVNKLRFCQILDKFKDETQFIVITHAPPTIARANTVFGVTTEEPGVSKVVSLKMEEAKQFAKKLQEAV